MPAFVVVEWTSFLTRISQALGLVCMAVTYAASMRLCAATGSRGLRHFQTYLTFLGIDTGWIRDC
ncbi:hypothetical protein BJY00DRAFT_285572 [Aspergillus carlsbadensis]|nr:hypothetical protein BJY00DRAFT_285572 [Aspergillus carlsbadensis]